MRITKAVLLYGVTMCQGMSLGMGGLAIYLVANLGDVVGSIVVGAVFLVLNGCGVWLAKKAEKIGCGDDSS